MLRTKSNFDFLKNEFPHLFKAGSACEVLLYIDAESCIAKLRLFGELWLYNYYKVKIDTTPVEGSFGRQLLVARENNVIGDDFFEYLEQFRKLGNRAIHVSQSYISEQIQTLDISKTLLIKCLQNALTLAEHLYRLCDFDVFKQTDWVEPEDYYNSIQFKKATLGSSQECFEIGQLMCSDLALYPASNKKQQLTDINRKIIDCEFWLLKAHDHGHKKANVELIHLYNGKYHVKAKSKSKLETWLRIGLQADEDGEISYIKGSTLLSLSDKNSALRLLSSSADKGNHDAIELLVKYYYLKDPDKHNEYIEYGVKLKSPLCLIVKLLGLTFNKNKNKEFRSLYAQCRALSAPGTSFMDSIAKARIDSNIESPNESSMSVMAEDWSRIPDFANPAVIALHFLYQHDFIQLINSKLINAALTQSMGSDLEGMVCFYCAIVKLNLYEKYKTNLKTEFSSKQFLVRSASLGFEQAIEVKKELISISEKKIGRGNKQNRKRNKIKRKQNIKTKRS